MGQYQANHSIFITWYFSLGFGLTSSFFGQRHFPSSWMENKVEITLFSIPNPVSLKITLNLNLSDHRWKIAYGVTNCPLWMENNIYTLSGVIPT